GNQGVGALGRNVAAFLAEYAEALAAVVYFARDGETLAPVGSYALPGDVSPTPGGLTRQAFVDRRIVRVNEVPPDYLPISSGLGGSRPKHLLIVPATVDGGPTAGI